VPSSSSLSFTTLPRYYDYQARADYELVPHLKLSAFLFGSDDKLAISTDAQDPDDPARGGTFSNTTSFTRAIASATYDRPGVYNRLAVSAMTEKVGFDVGTDRYLRNNVSSLSARDDARVEITNGVSVIAGGEVEAFDVDVDVKLPRPPKEGDPTQPNFTYDTIVDQQIKAKPVDASAWAALELVPGSWLKTTAGARVDAFTRNNVTVVEPRIQNRITVSPTTAVLAAAGLYTRPPQNQDENLQTDLKPERSWQTSLGMEEKLAPGVTVTATTYYNKLSDMVVPAMARDSTDAAMDYYNNDGIGKSYGVELLAKARSDRFFGWAAYTYSRSERRDHPASDWRLFDTDQSHNLVLVGSYKHGEHKQWQFGGRFQFTTGTPYTPVEGAIFESDKNTYQPVYGATNSIRNGSQHQLDLRVDRYFTFHDWKLSAYLDVSNVYMNAAVVGYQYNSDFTKRTEITTLPILPSFGVRGEL
jgi:outer membrane receptor protein involved in Fe transport